jgi:hypothetical protein
MELHEVRDALQQTIEQVRTTIRVSPPSAPGPYAQLSRQAMTLIGLADRLSHLATLADARYTNGS